MHRVALLTARWLLAERECLEKRMVSAISLGYIYLGVAIGIHSSVLNPKLLHPEPYGSFYDLFHSAYLDLTIASKSKELMHPSLLISKFVGKEILDFSPLAFPSLNPKNLHLAEVLV